MVLLLIALAAPSEQLGQEISTSQLPAVMLPVAAQITWVFTLRTKMPFKPLALGGSLSIGDSGPKRTGFLGEGENRSWVKANTIPGPTRTKIPAGTRMVFVPPRNCFRDGPE